VDVARFEHGVVKELRLNLSSDGFVVRRVAELQGVAGDKEECANDEDNANAESQSQYIYSRHLCPPTKTAIQRLSLRIHVHQLERAPRPLMNLAFEPPISLILPPLLRMYAHLGARQ
jgi:hypothetical protein